MTSENTWPEHIILERAYWHPSYDACSNAAWAIFTTLRSITKLWLALVSYLVRSALQQYFSSLWCLGTFCFAFNVFVSVCCLCLLAVCSCLAVFVCIWVSACRGQGRIRNTKVATTDYTILVYSRQHHEIALACHNVSYPLKLIVSANLYHWPQQSALVYQARVSITAHDDQSSISLFINEWQWTGQRRSEACDEPCSRVYSGSKS